MGPKSSSIAHLGALLQSDFDLHSLSNRMALGSFMGSEQPSSSAPGTEGIFPHTRWSMVLSAKDSQDSAHPLAMEELCQLYWRPVYLYIRSRGNTPEESEDLAQEFFHRLLQGHYLKSVEGPEKGRLRSFLCVVLKRFLADDYDKRMALKRGGDWKAIPMDGPAAEALLAEASPDHDTPDLLFDRSWALDLLDHSMRKLEADYTAAGKAHLFEKLKPTISPQLEGLPYAELAKELEMTEGALKVAVHRFRQRYRDCLHATLQDTIDNPEDTEEELRYLLSVFSKP
jgi:RNA polymerase sigma factor (sigma-70 family)